MHHVEDTLDWFKQRFSISKEKQKNNFILVLVTLSRSFSYRLFFLLNYRGGVQFSLSPNIQAWLLGTSKKHPAHEDWRCLGLRLNFKLNPIFSPASSMARTWLIRSIFRIFLLKNWSKTIFFLIRQHWWNEMIETFKTQIAWVAHFTLILTIFHILNLQTCNASRLWYGPWPLAW